MACSSRGPDSGESLTTLMEKLVVSPMTVGSEVWVDVTHIHNPSSFYVRPTAYNHYLPTLEAPGNLIGPDDLYIGNNVVFKSKIRRSYIRGHIIFIDEEYGDTKLEVFAKDYGHIERAVSLDIVHKPLHANFVPCLVKHCQLELCKPPDNGMWTPKAIVAMKSLIGNEKAKILILDTTDDLLTVRMNNSCPGDISSMLALTGYSVLENYENGHTKQTSYLFQELKINDSIHVKLLSGKNLKEFYVAEINCYEKYLEERENVACYSKHADAVRLEDLCKGKPVCVPTDNHYLYERAVIKEIDEQNGKALVQLVDWGDVMQVPFEHIKPILEPFLASMAKAIYCAVDDTQVWDNKLMKFLDPGCSFIITVKNIGDSLETPNIVNISEMSNS